ncbi:MAG: hypothetical protein KC503_41415 [Myxococcales bacterium]|nr:hypothetical protein [Myxococcales bacterium]
MKAIAVVLCSALLVVAAGCAKPCNCKCDTKTAIAAKRTVAGASEKVALQMYVMSKCPFAVEAERAIKNAIAALGQDRVELRLDYIVDRKVSGEFEALHGPSEVKGNIVQLCVQQHAPAKLLDFIDCQNGDPKGIPANWERCASVTKLDVARIKTCYEGAEGKSLLAASMKRAQSAGATGSPTILLGGSAYEGGRGVRDFMRAMCGRYLQSKRPSACNNIPEPVEVRMIALTDKRCGKGCAVDGLVANLRARFFPKLAVKTLDYGSAEGKKLFAALGIKHLPALTFDSSVTKAEKFALLKRWMSKHGDRYMLAFPARFDPTAEICNNKKDDTGNGLVDCADPTCKQTKICRTEIKGKLDVFVMSQCPYGAQALLAMDEVLKNFKGKIKLDVHYIASKKKDGSFDALHGPSEVAENIRQLCAKKHYGKRDRYLSYVWCRAKDYRSNDWKKCATGKIKAKVIERCAKKLGDKLQGSDADLASVLQIDASPTFLANNRYTFSGITAEQIKQGICKRNPKLAGCKNKLSNNSAVPAGSCGGGS